jgi:hypothetical protein
MDARALIKIDPEAVSGDGLQARATLYLLRIPGMKHLLLEDGGAPTHRLSVKGTDETAKTALVLAPLESARPPALPTR